MKKIIFTGGGSGGHVMPAVTLIKALKVKDPELQINYIGGHNGIEKQIIQQLGIPYSGIATGKLRRYLSWENFKDVLRVFKGILDAYKILAKNKKQDCLVFSTGGFVTVPVVVAAKALNMPIYIHEQTSRVGLANKIASYFAKKIFISFSNSSIYFPKEKVIHSGYPVRASCFSSQIGSVVIEGKNLNSVDRPIIFVTGGGNGSSLLNELIKKNLPELKQRYFIVHQVGKNFLNEYSKYRDENYLPIAFINEEMIDLYKLAKVIISRAGAGTVCELMALKKRSIFVPLKIAQKNEQYHNAKEAERLLGSSVITEDDLLGIELIGYLNQFVQVENIKNFLPKNDTSATNLLVGEIGSHFGH